MRVLVLGASGMLGNAMLRTMAQSDTYEVWGTARSASVLRHFDAGMQKLGVSHRVPPPAPPPPPRASV